VKTTGSRSSNPAETIRFGPFELDVRAGELCKGGSRIRLPDQPLQVLLMLLERPGEVVLRQEIQNRLWPTSTVVEFDQSINAAVRRLRDALRESADKPRYIETIPRRGYRFIGQVEAPDETQASQGATVAVLAGVEAPGSVSPVRPRAYRPWLLIVPVSAALVLLTVIGAQWYERRQAPVRWAREVAPSEAGRLLAAGDYAAGFALVFRALQSAPKDAALNRMLRQISYPISIRTTPPGASIYLKPYTDPEGPWLLIGQSPLENFLLPTAYFRWKITKPGCQTVELSAGNEGSVLAFALDPKDAAPADMAHVPAGETSVFGMDPVHLDDYWIDKFEVTNKQFKEFADKGGYQNPAYWRNRFVKAGRVLSWKQAMDEFRDTTGRPGPSTWEVGGYPAGHDDFPVNGVSWFEAAAYAEFAKKQLPTVYHWYRAAAQWIYSDILLFSNFDGNGPMPVGSRRGVGRFGTYDMAGNVKEWCLNATSDRRYILGGSWNEGRAYYVTPDALSPFDRSPSNGFRCIKYSGAAPEALTSTVERPSPDRRAAKPVADSLFRILQNFYTYDRGELRPVVESSNESGPDWRTERISFNAAYDHERVTAWLYLPKHGGPPYQTVIYAPAGAARTVPKIDEVEIRRFDFLMKSGRAVLFPVYRGTYERRQTQPQGPGRDRDERIQQVQDLRRSVDYLETRTDIDPDRIGFFGISGGSQMGLIALALEPRIRAATLAEAGLPNRRTPPEIDQLNFAPRVRMPVQMLNGRYDFIHPVETDQLVLFRLLGSSPNEKRNVLFDKGHMGQPEQYIKETLDWFDRYLGPVSGPIVR
jgi:DNA-binding winged helix-turn-helix (wHTH) protein/cephalosporin-C deacetylase-like acetyl esterase